MGPDRPSASARNWLTTAGLLSSAAALLHLAVIAGGADWYRFFGAGEAMARMAERGELYPTLVTIAIAALLGVWAAYAFSGAGLIRRLPMLRTGLIAISAIYLLRAAALPLVLVLMPDRASPFDFWSGAIVAVYGATYAIGTTLAWPLLNRPERRKTR